MLVGKPERGVRFLIPLTVVFIFISIIVWEWDTVVSYPKNHILHLFNYDYSAEFPITFSTEPSTKPLPGLASSILLATTTIPTSVPSESPALREQDVDPKAYREVYSASTPNGRYFLIDFVNRRSINPNIIPHPSLEETWIIVAQLHDPESKIPGYFAEITCNAIFHLGALQCVEEPTILPITTEIGDKCEGKYVVLNLSRGPHDARIFFGPDVPYSIYGSNSKFTCFGQFVRDFRTLVEWGDQELLEGAFQNITELQRPLPFGSVEKNWFLFWDKDGQMYVHHDISPRRTFAKLAIDGSVGEDLAPQAAVAGDEKCMERYMPSVGPESESIHQATNSLSITMCKRSDPLCVPDDSNTFVFIIFQHKRYRYFHSVYEPYVMLFGQSSPFKIQGISSKPFWIHGRWHPDQWTSESHGTKGNEFNKFNGTVDDATERSGYQPELMYVTSMSWKSNKQKYHGFLDDVAFLGFGIEDHMSAGIDLVVGDLFLDLALC